MRVVVPMGAAAVYDRRSAHVGQQLSELRSGDVLAYDRNRKLIQLWRFHEVIVSVEMKNIYDGPVSLERFRNIACHVGEIAGFCAIIRLDVLPPWWAFGYP